MRQKPREMSRRGKKWVAVILVMGIIFGIFGISNAQPVSETEAAGVSEESIQAPEVGELPAEAEHDPNETATESGADDPAMELPVERSAEPEEVKTEQEKAPDTESVIQQPGAPDSNMMTAEDHSNPDILDVYIGTDPENLELLTTTIEENNQGGNVFYTFAPTALKEIGSVSDVYLVVKPKAEYAGKVTAGEAEISFQVGNDSYDLQAIFGEKLKIDANQIKSAAYGDYDQLNIRVAYPQVWFEKYADGTFVWEQGAGSYYYHADLKNIFAPSEAGTNVNLEDYIGVYQSTGGVAIEIYRSGDEVKSKIIGELTKDGEQAEGGLAASTKINGDATVVSLILGYTVNANFIVRDGTLVSEGDYSYRGTAGETTANYSGKIVQGTVFTKEAAKVTLISNGTQTPYFTIQGAVNAAADGDTIALQAGTYTENVALTRAVTLTGPEEGEAVLTGGISLAGPFADGSQTVIKGIVFHINGIYANSWGSQPNLNNITIENNTFDGIAYTIPNCGAYSAIHFNLDPAKPVSNLVIQNNTITNVTGANASGITLSDSVGTTVIDGNTIDSVSLNCIQLPSNAAGSVSIRNNYLKNWDVDIAGGGRAVRLGNMNARVSINENSMVRTLAAGEDGAEIIKVTAAATKIDAARNYWNSAEPDFEACLNPADRFEEKPYYSDEARTKLVEFAVRNERTGEEYEALQTAVSKAEDGDTLLLGRDCTFGTTEQTGYDPDGIGYGLYGKVQKAVTIRSAGGPHIVRMTGYMHILANVTLENVTIDGESEAGRGISIRNGATLTLNDGAILTHVNYSSTIGGVRAGDDSYLGDGPGKLIMNDGSSVVDFPFGGVTVGREGTFIMNGGVISGNGFSNKTAGGNGVYVRGGTFQMNHGTISGNYCGNGGGVYVNGGTFTMEDGLITGNQFTGNGNCSGVYVSGTDSIFTMNGGEISRNGKAGCAGIYVSGTNCILSLNNAVIKDNAGTNYGGVRMSGTGAVVNISGNTQITGNTNRSGAASNLIVSNSAAVNITGDLTGARIGVTPASTSKGSEIAAATEPAWINPECFVPDKDFASGVSIVRIGDKLMTGIATEVSTAGLKNDSFIEAGVAPTVTMKELTVKTAAGVPITDATTNFAYYADNSGAMGIQLENAPTGAGTYWVRAFYEGTVNGFYGASASDAYCYKITAPADAQGINLDKTELILEKDAQAQLVATVTPEDAKDKAVVWSTSDDKVAKVEDGKVTAIGSGNAVITATTVNGKTAECNVTVVIPVTNISLSNSEILLHMETKGRLIAFVQPENATDRELVWSSSNPRVLTVDQTGTLFPVSVGKATLTVQSANEVVASCAVTVTAPEVTPVVPGTDGKEPVIVEPEIKDNTIDSDTVREAVAKARPEEVVVVKVNTENSIDSKISADMIRDAAQMTENGGAKSLVFELADENGAALAFILLDLANVDMEKLQDVNLGFVNDVSDEVAQQVQNSIPEGAGILFIHLTHDGAFPCPVTRIDYVGGTFRPGSNVYLYWIDSSGGLCEEQELTVDEHGYVTYTIMHASPYVISDQKVMAKNMTPGPPDKQNEDGGNKSNPKDTTESGNNPANDGGSDTATIANTIEDSRQATAAKTGDEKDIAPYIWITVLVGSVAAGSTLLLRKRQAGKK